MKFQKSLLTATLLAAGSLAAVSANAAGTATGDFKVLLTVESICNLTAGAASDINLGTVKDGTTKTGTNSIAVACSTGTLYKIGLKPSDGSAGGIGVLTGPEASTIGYKLSKDADGKTPWGNTAITNTVDATGTGVLKPISYPVYATTTTSTDVMPGTYSDTVTVTVTY